MWNRGVSYLLEFNMSSCSSNHHCHLFQKIFWPKYQMFPELWRIWRSIREDCFRDSFCEPNYFNPSYCRTSFSSFPLPLFFFHLLFLSASSQFITMFTSECIHCHSVISLENIQKTSRLLSKPILFRLENSISNTGKFGQFIAPLRNMEQSTI